LSGDETSSEISDRIYSWVEKNRTAIAKAAYNYFRYSPSEMNDYMQQAFVSAMDSLEVARRKGSLELFPNYFG
jgi:hypothetical protein